MKSAFLLAASLLAASSLTATIPIETVIVGDINNPSDTTGLGSVSYEYHIGKYEVTNAQYAAFLNAVAATDAFSLYNTDMASAYGGITRTGTSGSYSYSTISGKANHPVNYVTFWDAARFANWLTTGNTETGVYLLNGVLFPTNSSITRNATAWANGGVAITSENEWYKAAYYSGSPTGADGDGYWLYPTQSNTQPNNDVISPDPSNNANFYSFGYTDALNYTTPVGEFENSASHYGTFDQAGNVMEWNDTITDSIGGTRGSRGGSFENFIGDVLQSPVRGTWTPGGDLPNLGFRVSSLAAIPEPSTYAAIVGGLALVGAVIARRRKK